MQQEEGGILGTAIGQGGTWDSLARLDEPHPLVILTRDGRSSGGRPSVGGGGPSQEDENRTPTVWSGLLCLLADHQPPPARRRVPACPSCAWKTTDRVYQRKKQGMPRRRKISRSRHLPIDMPQSPTCRPARPDRLTTRSLTVSEVLRACRRRRQVGVQGVSQEVSPGTQSAGSVVPVSSRGCVWFWDDAASR
jgi:hypothetical protein